MNDFLKRIADFSPKRLLLLAAELEEKVRSLEGDLHAPIAIVGMGMRFPGGIRDADSYWDLLSNARDAITDVPLTRWNAADLFDPDPHAIGKVATCQGGFIDSPELFDPSFFGIAPIEAEGMDPQQRLLLEVSWEALEDAAIAPSSLSESKTGVYVGLCNSDYSQRALSQAGSGIDAYFAQGASHAVAAGRISYFLGLRGPSLAIDTSCSSSLVAVHQAMQSLRMGEIHLALAGGVNLLFSPEVTMALSRAQMLAPDGRCKPFSAEANGFGRGEGCGIVVLKRLDDAVRDRDRVLAVIRGTAVNQDGRSSGITAPNGPSQEDVIHAALTDAGITPHQIGYVEAHGTGTNLGDPIELRALDAVLGSGRSETNRLFVGSVKSNFGHAESAAGVAGLIKLVLALQHAEIPASLHFQTPNPSIDWAANRLRIPIVHEQWQPAPGNSSRIGSVSSFGFSGTNAHLIVEQAPVGENKTSADLSENLRVVTLSARTPRALRTVAARLADTLREQPTLPLEDVAYTLAIGRSSFNHRAAIRPDSTGELIEELSLLAQNSTLEDSDFATGIVSTRTPRIAFLFAGQGGERTGMGLSLLEHNLVFQTAVQEVDTALAGSIPYSIEAIFRDEQDQLAQSALVQPALFAFQYGLARVWQNWGVEPQIVAGHSMGEIVAATIAGVLTVADASILVAARGRLTGELADPGGMVAVAAPEDQVLSALAPYSHDVSIAAINGVSSVVISGRSASLECATQVFEREGIRVKRLNITYGSHSPAMHRVLQPFYQEASKIAYNAPRIPILADLSGEKVSHTGIFNAQYFTRHLSQPVQFRRVLAQLEREKCTLCIEMGPRAVLTTFGREQGSPTTRWVASATGKEKDSEALQTALAESFAAGAPLDWQQVFRAQPGKKIALPTYPFERERYWIADRSSGSSQPSSVIEKAEIVGSATLQRLDTSVPIFEIAIKAPLSDHLDQHKVGTQVVMPASKYLSLAADAYQQAIGSSSSTFHVQGLKILRPFHLSKDNSLLQVTLEPAPLSDSTTRSSFQISSRSSSKKEWTLHATGAIANSLESPQKIQSPSELDRSIANHMSGQEFYARLEQRDVHLGPAFRAIQELWYIPGIALARLASDLRWHAQADHPTIPNPGLLDACFQVLGAAASADQTQSLRLMVGIDDIAFHQPLRGELYVEAETRSSEDGSLEGSLYVRDPQGKLLIHANGIQLRAIAQTLEEIQFGRDWRYEEAWEPKLLPPALAPPNAAHWIVLGDPEGLAGQVVAKLRAQNCDAETGHDAETSGEIARGLLSQIVDLRAAEYPPANEGNSESLPDSSQAILSHAVTLTLDHLDLWKNKHSASPLWLFTRGAHAPINILGARQAPLWGIARCATLEHPGRLRRIVDLDPNGTIAGTANVIIRELLASEHDEEQVAYQGETRTVFRLKRSEQIPPRPVALNQNSSYLLTGGLGGLGLQVARWLAAHGARQLILTTRSFTTAEASKNQLDEIRATGCEIIVVLTDVADQQSMQALFAKFDPTGAWLPLRGIMHMAADMSGAPVEDITPPQVESIFRAKVAGTWLLHQLTQNLSLDFFIAFSSTTAVTGSRNLASYAAANAFVDAMASLRSAANLPFTSINWGTWQTMRLANEQTQQHYSSGGMLPMRDNTALDWLGDLIGRAHQKHAIVAHVDWNLFSPLYEAKGARRWLDHLRPGLTIANVPSTSSWAIEPGESRHCALERLVQKEAARVLGLRRGQLPPPSARLADLGLDSLMAVNLRNRLQSLIGVALPPTFAFEHPTSSEMAAFLDMLLWGSGIDEHESATERDEIQI